MSHLSQAIYSAHQFPVLSDTFSLPLTLIHLLRQHGQLAQGLLEGCVVGMAWGRMLEEVLNEEDVAGDALDRFDEEVIQGQFALTVTSSLLSQEK